MAPVFELPVFSLEAARTAIAHGATRLELNRAGSYPDGGLTPTRAEVEAVVAEAAVPVRVMIRPRGPPSGGLPDFLYTDHEVQQMVAAIRDLAASGLLRAERGDGFVFGLLAADAHGHVRVDTTGNRRLVDAARPYACVFHRAFDAAVAAAGTHPETALAAVQSCGFAGILTAGGTGSRGAADHPDTLAKLVAASAASSAQGSGCEIIVGGGVRSRHLASLAKDILPASPSSSSAAPPPRVAFHSSCLTAGLAAEAVDGAEVERIVEILKHVQ